MKRCAGLPFVRWMLAIAICITAISSYVFAANDHTQPNVLFIAIDDMNDWTSFLEGHPQSITPNMDRLAKRGVSFTNAHCIAPACSPCRLALLYGIEPHRSGLYPFYDHQAIATTALSTYTSLPNVFRQHGYRAYGAGKIFHGYREKGSDWDEYHQPQQATLNYVPEHGYQQGDSRKMAFCPTNNPLPDHPDYQVASYGIDVLSRPHDEPFFLAVGIVKPHLPFVCPQSFFDQQASVPQPPLIKADDLADVPWAGRAMAKLSDDYRFRKDESWDRVRRSYLACITWADYNVGRVLDALRASPYADNTIIVLWSDHGYHQGEKRSFRKFTLWEESTRVPMIVYDPRLAKTSSNSDAAHRCDQPVSLINLYRTLGELCDLQVPEYVDGQSLVPQLKEPTRAVDRPALTTWGRGNYTLRDERWRYIRYFDGSEELYDHSLDPQEWNNLADEPRHQETKRRLAAFLPKQEAPLVRTGISLWNVIDADRPEQLEKFRSRDWPQWKFKLAPPIE